MWMLAFDTCLDKTYVTLTDGVKFGNKVILSNDKNYHSAYLISTIIETLKEHNLDKVKVVCQDKGALDYTIKARLVTAINRMEE